MDYQDYLPVVTVVLLAAVIGGKFYVGAAIQKVRQKAIETDVQMRKARGELKAFEQNNAAEARLIKAKERKKITTEKQITRLKAELAALEDHGSATGKSSLIDKIKPKG